MRIILRPCLFCGHDIETKRSHTILHSTCHVPHHRLKNKLFPDMPPEEFNAFCRAELKEGRHPNPKHKINQKSEEQQYGT
ncbi:hypothetical protein [Pseudomonas anguilliseptica]|uniref:Uncharacterized protein n=1 Tax=Pseudomonas anguilliseptica TaxID=53406 RepID=A0A1H5LBI8_PSEAG|nr:hypothetical protein [Pseudomonas anguilliseptica]SEC12946.1 hypothetical protein SAMN05421553_0374 [Pseudomonas anguilliseptica]SEE74350.1 hypothetical protein SAMN05421553_4969 [Pseudomonas anguilliseptica]